MARRTLPAGAHEHEGPDRYSDRLKAHRERMVYAMGLVALVIVTPFAINNFVQGRALVGTSILLAIAAFVVDAVAIHLRREPPIPFWLLILPMAGAMSLATVVQGIYGALWSYPLVLYCYVVLTLRSANIAAMCILVCTTALVYFFVDPPVSLRIFATLALTVVLINIVVRVVLDLETRLVEQAITDPLTGAYNRRYMHTRLSDIVARHRRTQAAASLLVVDIDRFKRINDEFGHQAGDDVIKATVALLRSNSRRSDLLFRAGGEEFILLLPDTDETQALVVGEHVRSLVAAASLAGREVTVSIGLAQYRAGESIDEWLSRADGALYRAKKAGRNRVSVHRPSASFGVAAAHVG